MDRPSNNRSRSRRENRGDTGRRPAEERNSQKNKTNPKKDRTTIIFRILAIELAVVACILGFGIYYYAGSVVSEAWSMLFNKKSTGEVRQEDMPIYNDPLPTLPPAQPQSTEPQTEAAPEPVTVRLTALGDNLMQSSCVKSGLQPDGVSYSYDRNFTNVMRLLEEADLAVISQDTVIGGKALGISEGSVLNAPFEIADAIDAAGIDVVLTANNHILDKGREGITNMIRCFAESHPDIVLTGVNDSVEQKVRPVYIERNGIKFGLVNYTDVSIVSDALTAEPYLVNYYDSDWVAEMLEEADREADFVIAFPFWGQKDSLDYTPDQEKQAKFLADHGADLIIGTYPHVVEPVKWIQADDGREVLVYYSLGNFQSNQKTLENMLGAAAVVDITKTTEGTKITQYNLDFLVTHYQVEGNLKYYNIVTTYLLDDYTESLAANHGLVVSYTDPDFSAAGLAGLSSQILQKCDFR